MEILARSGVGRPPRLHTLVDSTKQEMESDGAGDERAVRECGYGPENTVNATQ
jgi:hypothetical protein